MSILIPKTREELEELIRPYDEIGSYIHFVTPAGTKMELVLDHLYVVRAIPDIGSDGKPLSMIWWLGWFPEGWTDGGMIARPHVSQIIRIEQIDDYWLLLHGSKGERMDLYWFNPPEDNPQIAIYDEWQRGAKEREAGLEEEREAMASGADNWITPVEVSPVVNLTDSELKQWQF